MPDGSVQTVADLSNRVLRDRTTHQVGLSVGWPTTPLTRNGLWLSPVSCDWDDFVCEWRLQESGQGALIAEVRKTADEGGDGPHLGGHGFQDLSLRLNIHRA